MSRSCTLHFTGCDARQQLLPEDNPRESASSSRAAGVSRKQKRRAVPCRAVPCPALQRGKGHAPRPRLQLRTASGVSRWRLRFGRRGGAPKRTKVAVGEIAIAVRTRLVAFRTIPSLPWRHASPRAGRPNAGRCGHCASDRGSRGDD